MEEENNIEQQQESPTPAVQKPRNIGGRPKKYPDGYEGPRGKNVILNTDALDDRLYQKLVRIQDKGIKQLEDSFEGCLSPQICSSALLNVRALMNEIKGSKSKQKSKEVAAALNSGNAAFDKLAKAQIAAGMNHPTDVARFIAAKNAEADK